MNRNRYNELVSAALDGELSDGERAELDRLLELSPEAQSLRAELERLNAILRRLPEPAVPGSLHGRIMASVRLPSAAKHRRVSARLPAFIPVFRYGIAAAAGLGVAVLFYESRPGFVDTADIMELVGTMAPDRGRGVIIDGHAAHAFASRVTLESRRDAVWLDVRVDAEEPVTITFDFAGAGVRVDALVQEGNPFESVEADDRILRMRTRGPGQLAARLHREGDATTAGSGHIEVEFSRGARVLERGSLKAPGD